VLQDLKSGATAMSINAAREHLASDGQRPTLNTVHRYIRRGARSITGARVRLEVAQGPSGFITTGAAVARFFARLNNLSPIPQRHDPDRAHEKAERQLAALGI
jgi:hypothetical protein